MLEAVERGIEGALLDQQLLARDLLDAEQHAVAVKRPERNGFQDEQVERALQQLGRRRHVSLLDWSREYMDRSPRMSKRAGASGGADLLENGRARRYG